MNKKIILSLINLLIGAVLLSFMVSPLWTEVKNARFELEQAETNIETIKDLVKKTEELSEEYTFLSKDINKFLLALPKEKDIPQLLVQFENLSINNGLLLESIQFGSDEENKKKKDARTPTTEMDKLMKNLPVSLVSLPISVQLVGSYEAFKNYLNSLETSLRSVNVRSMSVGAGSETHSTFDYSLDLNVYYTK